MSETETTDQFLARLRAEDKAKQATGENCYRCGSWILTIGKAPGFRRLCYDCKQVDGEGELINSKFIRCPKCRHSWGPFDSEDSFEQRIFDDGPHDIYCPHCEHEFEISTNVSYSFNSPELIKEEESEEEEEP